MGVIKRLFPFYLVLIYIYYIFVVNINNNIMDFLKTTPIEQILAIYLGSFIFLAAIATFITTGIRKYNRESKDRKVKLVKGVEVNLFGEYVHFVNYHKNTDNFQFRKGNGKFVYFKRKALDEIGFFQFFKI